MLAKRFHHQAFPNELVIDEDGYNPVLVKYLESLGHKVKPSKIISRMTFIFQNQDTLFGLVDPITEGMALGI